VAVSRYQKDTIISSQGRLATAEAVIRIRQAYAAGRVATREITLAEGQRLDGIASELYGDGRLWWVIAAVSGIGWWLQAPPGTRILVPTDINAVLGLV
jgi:hypothetical protein